jgi:hypothetical protein
VGYASQTLKYARSVSAAAVVIMTGDSPEYIFLGQAHKESILLNEFHLPVLCAACGTDK